MRILLFIAFSLQQAKSFVFFGGVSTRSWAFVRHKSDSINRSTQTPLRTSQNEDVKSVLLNESLSKEVKSTFLDLLLDKEKAEKETKKAEKETEELRLALVETKHALEDSMASNSPLSSRALIEFVEAFEMPEKVRTIHNRETRWQEFFNTTESGRKILNSILEENLVWKKFKHNIAKEIATVYSSASNEIHDLAHKIKHDKSTKVLIAESAHSTQVHNMLKCIAKEFSIQLEQVIKSDRSQDL